MSAFRFLPRILGMYSTVSTRVREPELCRTTQIPEHSPWDLSFFSGENSRTQVPQSSRTRLPAVSFVPNPVTLAVQFTHHGITINMLPPSILTLVFLWFFLVEQHQPNTDEINPSPPCTCWTWELFNSCLYLAYHKKNPELHYLLHTPCLPWSGAFPQIKDHWHLRAQELLGRCSARSPALHKTDSQNYWGGKAPLDVWYDTTTLSNPLPKAGSPKAGA